MPAITRGNHCKIDSGTKLDDVIAAKLEMNRVIDGSVMDSTPPKRKLRSSDAEKQQSLVSDPVNWKSPRRCLNSSPKSLPRVSLIFIDSEQPILTV